ncbi:DUF6082 family protein [Streptomyces spongiae]|uniref:Uncharacterized protein n=1 Tax=Streptomyces spongiae TaxID=565072 RepID=A0A5N8XV68_9ACTN|nr:DUF6082 family protein [Streptomyces spongiae]MPY63271.1 hypothetical protein [Streptomyces spongiae]
MNQAVSLISLAISTAALAVIAVSLLYQSRQMKMAQDENMRTHHRELIVMSMSDSELRSCWGGDMPNESEGRGRQLMFANLIFSWYYSAYMTKDVTEAQLRLNLDSFFRGEIGREYWRVGRSGWIDLTNAAKARKKRRFPQIVEECYRAASVAASRY